MGAAGRPVRRNGPDRRRRQDHRHVYPGPGAAPKGHSDLRRHHPYRSSGPSADAVPCLRGGGFRGPGRPRLHLPGNPDGGGQTDGPRAAGGDAGLAGGLRADGGRRLPAAAGESPSVPRAGDPGLRGTDGNAGGGLRLWPACPGGGPSMGAVLPADRGVPGGRRDSGKPVGVPDGGRLWGLDLHQSGGYAGASGGGPASGRADVQARLCGSVWECLS